MIPHRHQVGLGAAIGIAIIVANLLVAIIAPWIAPYGEAELIGDVWAPPSAESWLGLDNLGRDIFSRLAFGARTTISIALATTLLSFLIGIFTGFTAALVGGWVDLGLSRLVDALMAIPTLIFALIVISVMGTSVLILICTIAAITSTRVFRVSRSLAMNITVVEYFEAARLRGETLWWVIGREMLPNALPPLLAEFGLRFCFTILFIAALGFLGLGIRPPSADWGSMVRENAQAIRYGGFAPLLPAAAIALLTIGVNLVVDWFQTLRNRGTGNDL